MKFNEVKFLSDVEQWECRCSEMRQRQSEIVELRHRLRRSQERVGRLREDQAGLRNHRQGEGMRAEYDQQIAALQREIANEEAWVQKLEELQSRADVANRPLGALIQAMRQIIRHHRVEDPSVKVWS